MTRQKNRQRKNLRIGLLFSIFLLIFSCNSENFNNKEVGVNTKDTLLNKNIVNLGPLDEPQFFLVRYSGNLKVNKKLFKHIYVFEYKLLSDTLKIDTFYYETIDRTENIDFSRFEIELFPGTATIKVTDLNKNTHIMFYVLENSEYRHVYKNKIFDDLPTVSYQKDGKIISDNAIHFNITKEDSIYNITFKEESRVFAIKYKLVGNKNYSKLSFLNRNTGIIYTIEKDVQFKPIGNISFQEYK